MFSFPTFKAAILKDNPTYERVKTSDLHGLVATLQGGRYAPTDVAGAMQKIAADKWKKYVNARRYLIASIPALTGLLHLRLVNFRTQALLALPGGNIKHDAVWSSGTGKLDDLAHMFVREAVMWGVADPAASPFLDPAYRVAGHHYGVGNAVTSPGSAGNMSDTHDAKGAWGPSIITFKGPGSVSYRCTQVYQYSEDDKATWKDIPNSTYEIIRTASPEGSKLKLAILKRSIPPNGRQETQTNSVLL